MVMCDQKSKPKSRLEKLVGVFSVIDFCSPSASLAVVKNLLEIT
jgi:hypothetical protein